MSSKRIAYQEQDWKNKSECQHKKNDQIVYQKLFAIKQMKFEFKTWKLKIKSFVDLIILHNNQLTHIHI
jgi:hypothetical protein